jgi:hypothetical protein
MNPAVIRLVVLVCTFGCALLGMLLRKMLPERFGTTCSRVTAARKSRAFFNILSIKPIPQQQSGPRGDRIYGPQ